jgi:transposase InsO family protein
VPSPTPHSCSSPSAGFCILNLIDHFSKYVWSEIWEREKVEAVLLLVEAVLRERGTGKPMFIVSDNGAHFRNTPFEYWCTANNIQLKYGKAYFPEGQGVVEKLNGDLARAVSQLLCFRAPILR